MIRSLFTFLALVLFSQPCLAQKEAQTSDAPQYAVDDDSSSSAGDAYDQLREASSTGVRRFHEVLDDLLAEFGYDVKLGQLKGLKNLAVRRIEVSDVIPDTYREYVRTLLSERIRENSDVKLINCVPCLSRTSKLVDGKIVVTSPTTNIGELKAAAESLGIDNYLDAVLVYHTTHMVLAIQIFKTSTQELLWARTYNSETIKSRYQKLAIDYSQVAKARVGEDYDPEYRILIGVGGGFIPNVVSSSANNKVMDIQVRSTEKFDNRRTEFGLSASLFLTLNSFLKSYPPEPGTAQPAPTSPSILPLEPKPFSYALGMFATYSHNFLGAVESYNEIRQGMHAAIGTLLTTGYLGPTFKVGWDMFFGRRFVLSTTGMYVMSSQVLVGSKTFTAKGGIGAELVFSFNY